MNKLQLFSLVALLLYFALLLFAVTKAVRNIVIVQQVKIVVICSNSVPPLDVIESIVTRGLCKVNEHIWMSDLKKPDAENVSIS